jgi:hypothetical protein
MRPKQRWIQIYGASDARRLLLATALVVCAINSTSFAAVLLNDTWADAERASTNLPSNSPVWIGQSADNGSNSVSAGSLNFNVPTNSLKVWTYFTSNNSAPDGNQPHNAVTSLAVGDMLTAETSFRLPTGASTTAGTGKNYRFGLFHDPTNARVQADVNSDGGGTGNPWADSLGYMVQLPLHGTSSGNNPILIGKRTTSNTSLAGSSGAYALAPTGGTAYSLAPNTVYTVQLMLNRVSASQIDVTASVKQGNTVLSTLTASDTGTAFGGTAIAAGLLPGSQSPYTNFDHFFIRNSDSSQIDPQPNGDLRFTNFRVDHKPIPEPATMSLLAVAAGALLATVRVALER